jgi:hypothetical protein
LPPAATVGSPSPNPEFYYTTFNPSVDPGSRVALAIAAAQEIIGKLWRMEDTPLINGWEMTWSEYYWSPPNLNPGSYLENPANATPPLPDYFYSPVRPPNPSYTVFDWIAYINPQLYSSNGASGGATTISWLRDADSLDYQRTWFKITRKWLGAPLGAWDYDLYNRYSRPSLPSHYRALTT